MIIDVVAGFLGSGKTTFIRQVITTTTGREKLAVIVNEFGDIGIDGTVLSGYEGTKVVELDSGCICCTLSRDLVGQVEMIARNFNPDRLLIEPSGVATVGSLLKALRSLRLEEYVETIRVICILDAVDFQNLYSQSRLYVQSQLRSADLIVINKTDLVSGAQTREIMAAVAGVNAQARVAATTFGRLDAGIFTGAKGHRLAEELDAGAGAATPLPFTHGLEMLSLPCDDAVNLQEINNFLSLLRQGEFGRVVRAKGIIRLRELGWALFNLASGVVSMERLEHRNQTGKIFIVGTGLEREKLLAHLNNCAVGEEENE